MLCTDMFITIMTMNWYTVVNLVKDKFQNSTRAVCFLVANVTGKSPTFL